MALEFVQLNPATATTGALVAVDLGDFGTATGISVQMIKILYGTDAVFNEVGTGAGFPVNIVGSTVTVPVSVSSAATLPVTVATNVVFDVQQRSTSTSPVSLTTLPTTATLPVAVATGFIFSVQQTTTSTSPVSLTTLPTTATLPVTFSTSLYPIVDVGTPTATGLLADNIASATAILFGALNFGFATTATGLLSWHRLRSATTGVLLTNVQNTATVTLSGLPTTATLPVTVATSPIFSVQQTTTSTSPVSLTTLPTTATLPVTVATSPIFSVQQTTTSTSPVSLTSLPTTATLAVVLPSTATVNVANTATVQAIQTTATALNMMTQFSKRGAGTQVYFNVSGTGLTTMATAGGASIFRDMVWIEITNQATTMANLLILDTSTATAMTWNIAGDGGGMVREYHHWREQSSANTAWTMQLASEIVGKLQVAAKFMNVS